MYLPGGYNLEKQIKKLKEKDNRVIIGVETGNVPGRLGAAVVEVSGKGDSTVLDLHGFKSHPVPRELQATLDAFSLTGKFDSEEVAGMNFLILHHISSLVREVVDEVGFSSEDVSLIGLQCVEAGGGTFPSDPSVLSEMTNCIVVCRFSIGDEENSSECLPVKESLLRGLVGEMMDRFGLESEVREAVAVALLANESLFHESCLTCETGTGEGEAQKRPSLKSVRRKNAAAGPGAACLFGEFFFPA